MLDLCSSHYYACWNESYADRLPAKAMIDLLERSSASEIRSWLIGHGNRTLTVAKYRGDIVGGIASNCVNNKCYVWGMYIRQNHQRAGIGGMLLQRVIQKARGYGPEVLEITVLSQAPIL